MNEDGTNTKKKNMVEYLKVVKGLLKEVHCYVQASVNTSGFQTWLFQLSVQKIQVYVHWLSSNQC